MGRLAHACSTKSVCNCPHLTECVLLAKGKVTVQCELRIAYLSLSPLLPPTLLQYCLPSLPSHSPVFPLPSPHCLPSTFVPLSSLSTLLPLSCLLSTFLPLSYLPFTLLPLSCLLSTLLPLSCLPSTLFQLSYPSPTSLHPPPIFLSSSMFPLLFTLPLFPISSRNQLNRCNGKHSAYRRHRQDAPLDCRPC